MVNSGRETQSSSARRLVSKARIVNCSSFLGAARPNTASAALRDRRLSAGGLFWRIPSPNSFRPTFSEPSGLPHAAFGLGNLVGPAQCVHGRSDRSGSFGVGAGLGRSPSAACLPSRRSVEPPCGVAFPCRGPSSSGFPRPGRCDASVASRRSEAFCGRSLICAVEGTAARRPFWPSSRRGLEGDCTRPTPGTARRPEDV